MTMTLVGTFVDVVDKPNNNGRIYSKEIWESEIARLKEHLEAGDLYGTSDKDYFDADYTVKIGEVSHIVTDLKVVGSDLTANIEILDTPRGKLLQEMFDQHKDKIRWAPMGVGSCVVGDQGAVVQGDYHMTAVCWWLDSGEENS